MNKLNNVWSGVQQAQVTPQQSSLFSQLTPAQLMLLQQQFHQANTTQNFENLMQHQTNQHHQQQQRRHNFNPQTVDMQKTSSPFSSSFSMNSILNPVSSHQQQNTQQQLATAVLTRHFAQAMANINMHHQQQQGQSSYPINDSAFQAPARKKQKCNDSTAQNSDPTDFVQNPLNSSICSISSPSSSAYSTSSLSFDNTSNPELFSAYQNSQYQNLEYLLKNTSNSMENAHQIGSSSSTSVSFNESNEFLDGHADSERSSSCSFTNEKQKTPMSVRRSNRKRIAVDLQNPCCPICGLSLRLVDLQAHLNSELDRLERANSFCGMVADLLRNEPGSNNVAHKTSSCKRTLDECEKVKPQSTQNEANNNSRQQVYLKIKENRQARIKNKLRLRMRENETTQTHLCPLCNESIANDSKDQINIHLQTCPMLGDYEVGSTRDFDSIDNDEDVSDSNQDGSYETYEWAGQKRIRTITMLENPAQGIDATSVRKEEFEGELNVDFDDSDIAYGKPQFNESDLIPMKSDVNKKNLLRQAVIDKEKSEDDIKETERKPHLNINQSLPTTSECKTINENRDSTRCLICMDNYTDALISVNCWHVHCKTCWMQSLGAKKLCPQCKEITSPKDLRRIYL